MPAFTPPSTPASTIGVLTPPSTPVSPETPTGANGLNGLGRSTPVPPSTLPPPTGVLTPPLKYPRFCSDLYRRIRSMPRQYSPEFRDRALRLLDTTMEASDVSEFEAIKSVASKLGVAEESVRRWRRKSQIDAGERP
ncbi:MAG: hypothetical protein E6Q55_20740, partial [Mycolicibacterium mageritense]